MGQGVCGVRATQTIAFTYVEYVQYIISWRRMCVTLVFRNRSYNIRRQDLTRPASGVAGRGQSALVLRTRRGAP